MVKEFFSAEELASLALRGLPSSKRKINEIAARDGWAFAVGENDRPLYRCRQGRGGGHEYHWSLLPIAARRELIKRGIVEPDAVEPVIETSLDQIWAQYDASTTLQKGKAKERLRVLYDIDQMVATGSTMSAAVAAISEQSGFSPASIYKWRKLIKDVAFEHRLPYLVPNFKPGGRRLEISPEAWTRFKSDKLRPEPTTNATVYRRVCEYADAHGLEIPSKRTFERRYGEIDQRVKVLAREGVEAARNLIPQLTRTVKGMHALMLVNIDGHEWNVAVHRPGALPGDKPFRPLMVGIQDVYSRKILAWRFAETENIEPVRLAFADLFRNHGIPKGCLLDNGRAFASKWITGGAKTRFRWSIDPDDPLGILPLLEIEPHWATPYRGQVKPIERAWGDIARNAAMHPAFAGAYLGHKVDAKPENYGSRAVPWEVFERVVAQEIAKHNARGDRQTEMAKGRGLSFDDVFNASYEQSEIKKATTEMLRLALLQADRVRAHRKTGELRFLGNRYWSPMLSSFAGDLLTIRVDPDNLHAGLHAYTAKGEYIGEIPVLEAVGFMDTAAAKVRMKQEAEHRKLTRKLLESENLLKISDLAATQPDYVDDSVQPEARVIRPARLRGNAAVKIDHVPASTAMLDDFAAKVSHLRLVDNE